jgi:hypothetical protein
MKISWLLDKSGPGRAQNWLIRASVHGLNTEPAVGWFDQPMGQMPRWHDQHAFPLCISKQKGLAINSENSTKAYLNEMKQVIALLAGMSRKNAGGGK